MAKVISQYTADDGDQVTISQIGNRKVVEIVCNTSKKSKVTLDEDEETVPQQKIVKLSKNQRVARIKELISYDQQKTRTEVKDIMYAEGIYQHSPNPASAFAGDWNSIQ